MIRIYLDYNASTPIDPSVLKVLIKELEEEAGNPSSLHFHGQQSRRKLEHSRQSIARFFKVKPQEVIFTSGGTEGAALLLQGIISPEQKGHVISSGAEHSCVYQTLKELERRGSPVTFLPTGPLGAIQPEEVAKAIRSDTKLIALMAVNNETGVITDLEAIASIAQEAKIPFIVDGVAWLGKESLTIPAGVSAIFFSGHKIHAPKGIGCCICRQSLKLTPLFFGGGHEFNRRAGTENLSGIIALAEAIALLNQNEKSYIAHMRHLRDRLEQGLLSRISNVVINGTGPRICNTTNLSFLGVDGESLLMVLDGEGISVSHGSACSSGALEPSRILLDLGIPLSQAKTAIRFSVGRTTTQDEIDFAVDTIAKAVDRLRGHSK